MLKVNGLLLATMALTVGLLAACAELPEPRQPATEVPEPISIPMPSPTLPPAAPSPSAPPSYNWGAAQEAVTAVRADVVQRTGVPAENLVFAEVSSREWNDSSLGCPQPGFQYLQVITSGWVIVVEAGGESFEYHTNQSGSAVVLCQKGSPAVGRTPVPGDLGAGAPDQ